MKKWLALMSLLVVSTLAACTDENPPADPGIEPASGLSQPESVDALRRLVEPYLNEYQSNDGWFFSTRVFSTMAIPEVDMAMDAPEAESSATETGGTSETNVQIEGVDEGDIIKTDGERIYRIQGNTLTVIELLRNGAMETVLSLSMDSENEDTSYTYYQELYLTDQYIVATGQRQMMYSFIGDAMYRSLPVFEWGSPFSTVTIIDKVT